MSFIEELKNVEKRLVLNTKWVEQHKEITIQLGVEKLYDELKKHLLVIAKERGSNTLCGEYYLPPRGYYWLNLGDDIRSNNGQYNTFGFEARSRVDFNVIPNLDEVVGERVTYSGDDLSAYEVVNDNEVRLSCDYDRKCVYTLIAIYMTINCTLKGFFTHKYIYSVEFSEYAHVFVNCLKELASKDGVNIEGPFCTLWDNNDCKIAITEGEQVIIPDEKLSFFGFKPQITIKYKVSL